MTDTNSPDYKEKEHEGHFYKGLFFGLLIGVGVIWFINSEGGKDLVKKARKRLDETLNFEPGMEDYDIDDDEPVETTKSSVAKTSPTSRRFFQKKSK
ncbi:MAG: hypothetical protein A2Z11_03555 [Candidatus Woykebacteria bacterium RBG_16_43_9]|uniref:Uncharacterized protein n=1 Tax=Candidatus Woykebacteria bacterium RBG_16_43_9 TaxID=1802596 RepID=A0A1G1WCR1_9BACT|nr:MAG: hypothetical protein A2Z11_03555 [Candidatus Woykebacteria bacterium RBG_16_43_9]